MTRNMGKEQDSARTADDGVVTGNGGRSFVPRLELTTRRLVLLGVALVLLMVGIMLLYSLQRKKDGTSQDTQKYTASVREAQSLSRKGDAEAAAAALREYSKTAQDPYQKAYAQSLEGVVYERDAQYDKARTAYLAGKDLPGDSGGLAANEGLARVETKLGNKDAAIAYWRKCIELKRSMEKYPMLEQDIMNYKRYITALGGNA